MVRLRSSTPPAQPTGELLADHFDVEAIPLLVKLLAAARPLSVQVHPPKAVAAAGWRAQHEPGAEPVYSDPFEKTEMLVALEPFEAFAGWRALAEAADVLAHLAGHRRCRRRPACRGSTRGDPPAAGRGDRSRPSRRSSDAARAAGLPEAEVAAYRTVAGELPR